MRPDDQAAYWSRDPAVVATQLGSGLTGLSSAARQGRSDRLAQKKPRAGSSPWPILLSQFKSPILLLLVAASTLSFFLGQPIDGTVILAIIVASGALGFQHEFRASRAVAQLLQLVQTQSLIMVDGIQATVPTDKIVAGDVILLSAGSMVPGDALLIESKNLYVDQAALTGESFPVPKETGILPAEAPVSARTNVVFAGSHIISGYAKAVIVATGDSTQLGSIAQTLRLQRPETEFERGVRHFGTLLIEVTLLLTFGVFLVNLFRHQPPLESFLFALALAVGLTPQLLPAIISVNLSRGAIDLAKAKVIVKRLSAIESLGGMNVLCSDKTGTLSLGIVKVHQACETMGHDSAAVLRYAQLNASFQTGFNNPIDNALSAAAPPDLKEGVSVLAELPYDFIRKRLSIAVDDRGQRLLISKGALAKILEVCDTALVGGQQQPLDSSRQQLQNLYQQFSDQGYRVLGVATRLLAQNEESITPESEEHMCFQGFIVLEDPLRPEIAATVARLKSLGVELKVITGDNHLVAQRLARELGLDCTDVVTGADLHSMTDRAIAQQAQEKQVFAEIEPNQKERIVTAIKRRGFVVGYIGDGINDGAALHSADVGISVANAVDVAKEAADFVMLEPGLEVLANAVVEGRRTFANTMKYIFMATSANFGNMFSLAGASLLIRFLPLLPKQVLLMNFVTDIPEMTIASDSVDPEQLQSPQRWDIRLLRKFMIVFGILSSAFDFATFGLLLWLRASVPVFQTGWFVESVVSASLIVLIVRSRRPAIASRPSLALLGSTATIVLITPLLPFLPFASVLGFPRLPVNVLVGIAAIVLCYVVSAEVAKHVFWRVVRASQPSS